MKIQLSEHFSYKKLVRFTLPSIVMMIFTSIYGVVDGIFVSNFVGKTPFAALNLIMPVCMMLGVIGFMVGTGGSALVSKILGQGEREQANRIFSMLIYVSIAVGLVLTIVTILWLEEIAVLLGARDDMLRDCVLYGRTLLAATVPFILQSEFQCFLVVEEKPQLGLAVTVAAGVTNMVLDGLLVAVFRWGLVGAALATGISQVVGGLIPLVYFIKNRNGTLYLCRTGMDWKALGQTCANGSSEMMSNLSMCLVNILYNVQLMRFAGENGVAAYGVIMYLNFVFISIFIGYCVGCAPVISYHFGAGDQQELKSLLKKSLVILSVCAVSMTALGILLSRPLSGIFVGYDPELLTLTQRGVMIYSISFLLTGYNLFASSFFTALNNGVVSAVISFLRTLLFQIAAVLLLPMAFGLGGIWAAVIAAEGVAIAVSGVFFVTMRRKYGY